MASLDDLLAQLGLAPPVAQRPVAPTFQQPPPFDTSVVPGTAFGTPYPAATPPATLGRTDTRLTDSTSTAAPTGYTPQPRGALPGQITRGDPALFAPFRDLYSPAPAEQDPITALLGDTTAGLPGFRPTPPASRALTPNWAGQQAGQQYGAQRPSLDGLTDGERTLLRQHPAYGRAIARLRSLDQQRARRGMM